MQEVIIVILIGILGATVHSLLKYQSLSTDAQKANISLPFKQYLANDWIGIALSLAAVILWPLLKGEIINYSSTLENWVRGTSFLIGMSGSYILQLIFSRSKQWIRRVVDRKTNIADEISKSGSSEL